jgi:hypothetical protein
MILLDSLGADTPSKNLSPPPPFKLRGSDSEKITTALRLLRDTRLSPADLLIETLSNNEYNPHAAMFSAKTLEKR